MLRSLFAGVSGMKNNQTKMDVIGNNIANINTTAFKAGRVRFQDIFSQTVKDAMPPTNGRGGTNPRQVGLGMQVAGIDTITNQGSLQPTSRPLDCGIEGEGYFIVADADSTSNANKIVYTRDGAFSLDKDGNLITSDGYKVMGLSPDQNITLKVVYDKTSGGLNWASAGTAGTLDTDSSITINGVTLNFTQNTSIQSVIDSINNNAKLQEQGIAASYDNGLVLENVFDNKPAETKIEIGSTTGNFAGLTSNDSVNLENAIRSNPLVNLKIPKTHPSNPDVEIKNFSIEANGTIKGVYGNDIVTLGKIVLAKFTNPGGLSKLGGNLYTSSSNSGIPEFGSPNGNGYGDIQQGTLEMSNVDLASEFTEMIITSRAFQANSRTISTSDEMLQELLNLKR